MSAANDGGPAFPTYPTHTPGMTLRDWFAGQALAGTQSVPCDSYWQKTESGPSLEQWRMDIARQDAEHCYRVADAMIAARGRKS